MSLQTKVNIHIAVFGFGRIGKVHFNNANAIAKVDYIVEERIRETEEVLEKCGITTCQVLAPNARHKVFEDSNIKAILICTPTFTHKDIIIEALTNKKHVFCEKPMAPTTNDISECYNRAEQNGCRLYCSFNRRFDNKGHKQIYDEIRKGTLGTIYRISSTSRDHSGAPAGYLKTSGGIFLDCGIHDIDVMCWLAGEFPSSVYTETHCHNEDYKQIENEFDTAEMLFKFPSGSMGCISLSRNSAYGQDHNVEVFGSKGSIRMNNPRQTDVTFEMPDCSKLDQIFPTWLDRFKDAYQSSVSHFIECLNEDKEFVVTREQVLAVSSIIEACQEATVRGQRVSISYQKTV